MYPASKVVISAFEPIRIDLKLARDFKRGETVEDNPERRTAFRTYQARFLLPRT
jgi:hypothetical protein